MRIASLFSSRPRLYRSPKPLLNLGCGRRWHPAWTNCDLVSTSADVLPVDVRRGLPFESGTFDAVYASHVLEHLEIGDGRRFVREIFRILRPEGIVRIVVPDLEGIARAYLASLEDVAENGSTESQWRHRWMTLELLDQLVRDTSGGLMRRFWSCHPVPCLDHVIARVGEEALEGIAGIANARKASGQAPLDPDSVFQAEQAPRRARARFWKSGERHRWMYDRVSLVALLQDAGFRDVAPTDAASSQITGFVDACLDTDSNRRPRKPDSLYVEGVRP